jgi:hypothetical protein
MERKEQVHAVLAFYAFQMYTALKGDTVLPVTTDSGTYSVIGGVRPSVSVIRVRIQWSAQAACECGRFSMATVACILLI